MVANIDPLLNRATISYDAASRPIRTTNPLGNISTTVYDAASRRKATINALGNRVTTIYDAASRQIAVNDPNSHRTTFVYDNANRLVQSIDPLNHRTTYGYNAASLIVKRIDSNGIPTTYSYDNANRLTARRYPTTTYNVTFTYDAASQETRMQDSTGRTTQIYDADGRVLSIISPISPGIQRNTSIYDAGGRRTGLITLASGRFTYVYDKDDRLTRIQNPQGDLTTYVYDAASRMTINRLANGTRASYSYDPADRILRVANITAGSATLSSFAYSYDNAGNRTRVIDASANRVTYVYDKTDQLLAERRTGTNAYASTYTYDFAGNRLTLLSGGLPTTSTYDAANRILTAVSPTGRTTYVSSNVGNRISMTNSGGTTSYTYDSENYMTKAKLLNGTNATFIYNGKHRRVIREGSAITYTGFVFDGEYPLLEVDSTNTVQAVHTADPQGYGAEVSQHRGSSSYYYHFDGLGSTDRMTDSTGSVVNSYLYDAWGNVLTSSGSATNNLLYVGKPGYWYESALGLYLLRARWYDELRGTFLSPDPLWVVDRDTNLYCYMFNNPMAGTDPSGLIPQCDDSACATALKDVDTFFMGSNPDRVVAFVICPPSKATPEPPCICYIATNYKRFSKAIRKCIDAHEQQHLDSGDEICDQPCTGAHPVKRPPGYNHVKSECAAAAAEMKCLVAALKRLQKGAAADEYQAIKDRFDREIKYCRDMGGKIGDFYNGPYIGTLK